MTVMGPFVTTGEYVSSNPGQEKRWRYDITNNSSSGDINNMINFQINAGSDNDVLEAITREFRRVAGLQVDDWACRVELGVGQADDLLLHPAPHIGPAKPQAPGFTFP